MYVEQARKSKNAFWLYIIGVVSIGIVAFLGNLPFELALIGEVGIMELPKLSPAELMHVLPPNTTFFYVLLPFSFIAIAVLVLTKTLHKIPIREFITTREKIDWKRICFGFGTVIGFSALVLLVTYLMEPESLQWNLKPASFALLFLISVIMVPLQASAEEFLFRGYLMQGLGRIFPLRIFPFVFTSVLFGLMHFANPEVEKLGSIVLIAYVATGFFLGAITLLDEGLELALGFHAGNNLFLSLFVTSNWTVFQTDSLLLDVSEPNALLYTILPLVLYGIMFVIYAKRYKWKNYVAHLITSSSKTK